jgi:hypothetical protein
LISEAGSDSGSRSFCLIAASDLERNIQVAFISSSAISDSGNT